MALTQNSGHVHSRRASWRKADLDETTLFSQLRIRLRRNNTVSQTSARIPAQQCCSLNFESDSDATMLFPKFLRGSGRNNTVPLTSAQTSTQQRCSPNFCSDLAATTLFR